MRIMEGRVDAEARQLADAVKVARSAVDIDIGNRFGKEKYVLEDD